MIRFNDKYIATSRTIRLPKVAFDPDRYILQFTNMDFRLVPDLEYSLSSDGFMPNTGTFKNALSYGSSMNPDQLYELKYTVGSDDMLYKGATNIVAIFKNNINCKYFDYASYDDPSVIGYKDTNNVINIPAKHNLKITNYVTIEDFSAIQSDTIEVITNSNIDDFNCKDDRITKYTFNGTLNAKSSQFENMPNLESIEINAFSNCPTRMFCNSPKLYIEPMTTRSISSVGAKAFFNTPNIKQVVINTNSILTDTFSYDDSISDTDLGKAIFTKWPTLNNYDRKTIVSTTGSAGMLYYDPNDGTTKTHQCFVGLIEDAWENDLPEDNTTKIIAMNDDSRNRWQLEFRSNDNRVIGMQIRVRRHNTTTYFASIRWLPNNKRLEYGDDIDDYFRKNVLDYEYPNSKHFYLSDTELYGDTIPNVLDVFEITPITRNGLSSNVYLSTINGNIGEPANAPIEKVLYTGGVSGEYTININNGDIEKTLTYVGSTGTYVVYLTLATNNRSVFFTLYNSSTGNYIAGKDGKYEYSYDFTDSYDSGRYYSTGGREVYNLRLQDYFDASNLGPSSSLYLRMYYTGYTDTYYDLQLTKQLTGHTNEL